ncbi:MAG: DapH/DapD/GlmU-related protein [Candidatus Sericytochromatia bacterium]|nr:DapH/DapD/GlmU-related protein [Candidatus Sericytochromatia bacterium]
MIEVQQVLSALAAQPSLKGFGLIASRQPGTLTFLDSAQFLADLARNPNVAGVITTSTLAQALAERRPDLWLLEAEAPRAVFYQAHNTCAVTANRGLEPSRIAPSAHIDARAYVAPSGVVIGPGVHIEPMVTILPGVEIGANSVVRAGSSLGVEGFEHKRVAGGVLSVVHDRFVVIGEEVEIGANCTVARGLMGEDTQIGHQTKTDCLVHIAHCAKVGARCLVAAHAMIAGSAVIEDDVWIGPNASISSQVHVGQGAQVTLGAVVVRDVAPQERVTGNFAISHRDFLRDMKAQARARRRTEARPC